MIGDVSSSDHAIIRFDIMINNLPMAVRKNKRYSERKADWELFGAALSQSLSEYEDELTSGDPSQMAVAINRSLTTASEKAIPKCRPATRLKPPWWTEELSDLRKRLRRAARNRYTATGSLDSEYRKSRNLYTKQMRIEKIVSLRNFCTIGGKKPWGRLYKWLKTGLKRNELPT